MYTKSFYYIKLNMGDTEHVKVTSKTILGNLIRGQTIVYIKHVYTRESGKEME